MEEDIYVLNALLQQYFSLYQARYNSLCILKYVSIQINLALELYTLHTRTNTLVCINPDTTISVFLSLYQSRYNSLSNLCLLGSVHHCISAQVHSWFQYAVKYCTADLQWYYISVLKPRHILEQ